MTYWIFGYKIDFNAGADFIWEYDGPKFVYLTFKFSIKDIVDLVFLAIMRFPLKNVRLVLFFKNHF